MTRTPRLLAAALALAGLAAPAPAQETPKPPPEAAPAAEAKPEGGGIPWVRDYEAAKAAAAKEKKGILVYLTPEWFT